MLLSVHGGERRTGLCTSTTCQTPSIDRQLTPARVHRCDQRWSSGSRSSSQQVEHNKRCPLQIVPHVHLSTLCMVSRVQLRLQTPFNCFFHS